MATFLKWIKAGFIGWLYSLSAMMNTLEAKDLGIYGHVFPIEEEDLLKVFKDKVNELSKEELETVRNKVKSHYCSQFQNPQPIQGLKDATVYRVFYVDPTICSDRDIRGHEGKVVVPKGKCINPLETVVHLDALLFFDASNPQHVEWAKTQNQLVKWVLVKGKPFELEEKENHPVYFDQFGTLVKKFGITYLPAKVSQEGLQLKIEEFPLRS
jgi:conjugal transfer pilus assembly protein TraW